MADPNNLSHRRDLTSQSKLPLKEAIHNFWMADSREAVTQAFDTFLATYNAK